MQYSEKYDQWRCRSKLNTVGLSACRFWDENKMPLKYEDVDTKTARMQPYCQLANLWMQGRQFGVTLNCLDLQIISAAPAVCPF